MIRQVEGGKTLSCAVNPACGRERFYELTPAKSIKRVLIAGGGVAGMEAARVSAIRGHKVTLCEAQKILGGHLAEASVPDFKKDLETLNNWYHSQLNSLDIDIRRETAVTPELVEREKPDVMLIACGSEPVLPDVPGIEKPIVATCTDLLNNKKQSGQTVVIVGGGLIGCETALWLAQKGKQVTIVETLSEPMTNDAPPVHRTNRTMLLDLLALHKVDILTETTLVEVVDDGIIVVNKNSSRTNIDCDMVAIAVGFKSNDRLYQSLREKMPYLYALGDCKEPLNIMQAIWDSYEVCRTI